jgi:hypothetical protein
VPDTTAARDELATVAAPDPEEHSVVREIERPTIARNLTAFELRGLLGGWGLDCSDEQGLVQSVEFVLNALGIKYEPSAWVAEGAKADFRIGQVAILVRLTEGRPAQVRLLRELERFAASEVIDQVLVVGSRVPVNRIRDLIIEGLDRVWIERKSARPPAGLEAT